MSQQKKKQGRYTGIVLKEETFQAIKQMAKDDRRTVSSLIRIFLEDAVKERSEKQVKKSQ